MTPFLDRCGDDALDQFMGSIITTGNDLYDLDGETIFRRREGQVETCDASLLEGELDFEGGQP